MVCAPIGSVRCEGREAPKRVGVHAKVWAGTPPPHEVDRFGTLPTTCWPYQHELGYDHLRDAHRKPYRECGNNDWDL